jgi:hypothetical protein
VPKLSKGAGPVGLALSAYDVWRRLSPRQREQIARQARRYAPLVVAGAARTARAAAASLKKR